MKLVPSISYWAASLAGLALGGVLYNSRELGAIQQTEARFRGEILSSLPPDSLVVASSFEEGWLLGSSPGNNIRSRFFISSSMDYGPFRDRLMESFHRGADADVDVSKFPNGHVIVGGKTTPRNIYMIYYFR
ncbi:MAG TPA: hypothetical protein VGL56_05300 [Fimbriimonadaceae bacterium]|jgi:hypothetical protein